MDLMYLNDSFQYKKVEQCLKDKFGEKIEIRDASDDIHTDRFEVHLLDEEKSNYGEFLFKTGLAIFSFGCQVGNIVGEINDDAFKFLDKLFENKYTQEEK